MRGKTTFDNISGRIAHGRLHIGRKIEEFAGPVFAFAKTPFASICDRLVNLDNSPKLEACGRRADNLECAVVTRVPSLREKGYGLASSRIS